MAAPGRNPGRALTALELRHLKLLQYVRTSARGFVTSYDEQIEDFVLELRENGASVRGIAAGLEVGPSTVQTWTKNARRRRDS